MKINRLSEIKFAYSINYELVLVNRNLILPRFTTQDYDK